MAFSITPYHPKEHTTLVSAWLDEEAVRMTGVKNGDDWNRDIAYWQKQAPDTFHAVILGIPNLSPPHISSRNRRVCTSAKSWWILQNGDRASVLPY